MTSVQEEKHYDWIHLGSTAILGLLTAADVISTSYSMFPPEWQNWLHLFVAVCFVVKAVISKQGSSAVSERR